MAELEWNEDEDVDKYVEAYYTESDGFCVHIRIGIEQENSDHPIFVAVSHARENRWHLSADIDSGSAELDQAKAMAPKIAALLLEESRAQRTAALMGVVEGDE